MREAIKMEGLPLNVYVAADGELALAFLKRAENNTEAPRPQLVLLDINLPKIDGFEVLRTLRANENFKDLPVLVVTSSTSPADRAEAARLGAQYFSKPISYQEFLKIGSFLRRFLSDNNLL